MDGNQPPPPDLNFYAQDWRNSPDESIHLEELDHIELTHSQTDILERMITNDQLFVEDSCSKSQDFPLNFDTGHVNVFPDINYPVLCQQQQQVQHAFHPDPISSCSNGVPSLENWSGELNYHVEFNRAQDRTKATSWTFSSKLEKLFVQLDRACPVNFKLNIPPSLFSNYQIRGQIVYAKAEDFHDSVERCFNHQQKDTENLPHSAHVLRCDDASSSYLDHENNRHSVVIALKPPAPGCQYVSLCFRFMCLSSCIGSLNRRQTKLIFTLENLSGNEVGRYAADLRICSCPGRDIKTEEEKFAFESSNNSTASDMVPIHLPMFKSKTKKRKLPVPALPPPVAPAPTSAAASGLINAYPSSSVEDNDSFYILSRRIQGKANFEMVQNVVDRMLALINAPRDDHAENQSKRFKEEFP